MTPRTKISIAGYILTADSGGGWSVGRPGSYWDKSEMRDRESRRKVRYYGTLQGALKGLLGVVLHESALESIQELLDRIDEFQQEVDSLEI